MVTKKNIRITALLLVFFSLLTVWEGKIQAKSSVESITIKESSQIIQEEDENDGVKEENASQFQLKRLILFADSLNHSYGEKEAYYVEGAGYFLLNFESEEETESAYETLNKEYPGRVIIDEIISQDFVQDYPSYGTSALGMDTLYETTPNTPYKDQKVTVAVIDTGFNTSHPLLSGRLSSKSYDYAEGDSNVSEENGLSSNAQVGHGSHVSGIVASSTPDNVEILALKVMDHKGQLQVSYLLNAMAYALQNNADAVNLSIGVVGDYNFLDILINKAYEQNCLIVAAAGNDGAKSSYSGELAYPAKNDKTIAVGSISQNKIRSSFSDYSDTLDFVAPGEGIYSATASGTGLVTMNGTSMAAPFITAEVAYIKMKYPNITFDECYSLLKSYALDLGEEGFDNYYGWGMPDITEFFLPYVKAEKVDTSTSTDTSSATSSGETTSTAEKITQTETQTSEQISSLTGTIFKKGKNTYRITGSDTVTLIKSSCNTKTITVPDTVSYAHITYKVTKIGDKVFYHKKKCIKIVVGKYVIQIGKKTFSKCSKLRIIRFKGIKLKSVGKGTPKEVVIQCRKSVLKKYRKIWKGYKIERIHSN